MTTAVHPDDEVIWATSTTGDEFQCVHVADWLLAKARIAELEAALASVVKFAEQADDPEHHTLGLVKHIAIAALQKSTPDK